MVIRLAVVYLLAGLIMWTMSGCSVHIADPFSEGDVMITGDERGMNAFSDLYAAAISEGKASPDKQGAYWHNRIMQTERRPLLISRVKGGK